MLLLWCLETTPGLAVGTWELLRARDFSWFFGGEHQEPRLVRAIGNKYIVNYSNLYLILYGSLIPLVRDRADSSYGLFCQGIKERTWLVRGSPCLHRTQCISIG
jgi:hypothetical protein